MTTWIERQTPLRGDIYTLHRRPGHTHVILNDAYRGLRLMDPWDGSTKGLAPFSERFRLGGGAIGLLYLRADGERALAADFENECGALMDLSAGTATDVTMPPVEGGRSRRYVWDERGLVCTDGRGERFFSLEGDAFTKTPSLMVRKARPDWRRAIHQHTFPHGSVARVYNKERAVVTFHRADARAGVRVMRASWQDSMAWGSPEQRSVDDAAALPEDLFYVIKNVVWRHTFGHQPVVFHRPEQGWEVRGVETLEADGQRPAAVVTLLQHRVDMLDVRLQLTPLEGRPDPASVGQGSVDIVGQGLSSLMDGLRRAAQQAGPARIAAIFVRNTAHRLFGAERAALEGALQAAWGQADPQALAGLRAVRLFNGRGAHDFDTATFIERP